MRNDAHIHHQSFFSHLLDLLFVAQESYFKTEKDMRGTQRKGRGFTWKAVLHYANLLSSSKVSGI